MWYNVGKGDNMKYVNEEKVLDNVIDEFKNNWALVCAKKKDGTFNMCTIAWGSIGELWSKNVVTVYVKPIRYTNDFLLEDDYFTVTFFDDKGKDALKICGTKSGRDINKVEAANLKVVELENGITFEGFKRVYVCKKIYQEQFKKECFVDSEDVINKYYKEEPYHYFYIGQIVKTIEK